MTRTILVFTCSAVTAVLMGCGKTDEAAAFDAQFVAAEADKGNLEPLKNLSKACRVEVAKYGRRRAVCEVLDRAAGLRKPINIRL
jgi:ADP-dependent phosphofructokinase/glucokinase